ncbi:MAG: hypothetical protein HC913_02635 [Microscillaceae bacterium]|nr:hypothetical protein [Microscillaceae bacterium]
MRKSGYFFFVAEPLGLSYTQSRKKALRQACAFLWQAQAQDGAWHSQTHGLLKQGVALSPFILYTLLQVSPAVYAPNPQQMEKALQFILSQTPNLEASQALVLEYPNYTAAYTLLTLKKVNAQKYAAHIARLSNYLRAQQFIEHRQINARRPGYGGWGFGETKLPPGELGHVDLSHTRRILEALQATQANMQEAWLQKARQFLAACQSQQKEPGQQGSFYYSPVVLGANKAGQNTNGHILGYATATADGLLASLAAGLSVSSPSVQKAWAWLRRYEQWHFPGGISPQDPAQWHRTLVLYHIAVRAEAYQKMKHPAKQWRERMWQALQPYQQANGSFANPEGSRNKENDPLVGTALAIIALNAAQHE